MLEYEQLMRWKTGWQRGRDATPPGQFLVTREWIFQHSCSANWPAWTRRQKEMLGAGMHSGWITRATGTLIDDWRARQFEQDSAANRAAPSEFSLQ